MDAQTPACPDACASVPLSPIDLTAVDHQAEDRVQNLRGDLRRVGRRFNSL
jgi:hypothetical protein